MGTAIETSMGISLETAMGASLGTSVEMAGTESCLGLYFRDRDRLKRSRSRSRSGAREERGRPCFERGAEGTRRDRGKDLEAGELV